MCSPSSLHLTCTEQILSSGLDLALRIVQRYSIKISYASSWYRRSSKCREKYTFQCTHTHAQSRVGKLPFCTIDPNVGVVQVPDPRLEPLREIAKTNTVIPAAIEFVDIAGLVEGASKGEGLGNKFLANIREVDAIVHVVRCFEDADIIHNMGSVDPLRDIEVINTELILADISSLESQKEKLVKRARGKEKEAIESLALLERLLPHLNENKPAVPLDERRRARRPQTTRCSRPSASSTPATWLNRS